MSELTLSPLSLVSEDDLIRELKSRSEACLVVTLKGRPKAEFFLVDYKGLTTCIGLAERAKARMIAEALDPKPWDGDDEDFEG